jgi:acetylornithine deacetylase ArgE
MAVNTRMMETACLLRDLVALPSVNPMGRTLPATHIYEHRVTAYLEDFFRALGVPSERQPILPQRDNLVARWQQSEASRTLLLEVHQDTVPTDNMTVDPFGAHIENGRLYGRGACDIKGGMAAMLAMFARLVRERPSRASNVILACTVDEEHTFLGIQRLVREGLRADMAVVAEPTQLHIVNAHKGVARWFLETRGHACHSSTPEKGVNAVYQMAYVLPAIEQFAEWLRSSRVDPHLGPATLSVGRIEGGTSANTVPDRCRIEIDRRLIAGEDARTAPGQLAAWLEKALKTEVSFSCSEPGLHAPALSPTGSDELVSLLGKAIDSVRGGHQIQAVPYCTDGSTLAQTGIPTVVFGPGDVAKAHTCDEWVALEEVEQASEILYRLACAG